MKADRPLVFIQSINDDRSVAVIQQQLGTLAMLQGDLAAAATRYQEALQTFQQLREPASEAVAWHQLGRVYEEARQWAEAEQHYREAARIREQNNLVAGNNGAVASWNQLAVVSQMAGRVAAAKAWYEKAIAGAKGTGDTANVSKMLSNLAALLQSQPHPSPADLATARQHAEAALAIKQTLDPAAAEIWKTYELLAQIAEKQEQPEQARAYRQQARQAKAAFAGTQYELRQWAPLIALILQALTDEAAKTQLFEALESAGAQGANLTTAIRRILDGERDEDRLTESLTANQAIFVSAILQGIADPSTLAALLSDESSA